jgi:hypothetical protein
MPAGFIFWLLMLLWAVLGIGGPFFYEGPHRGKMLAGGSLLLFVLLFLVGWKLFGFVVT